MTQNLGRNLIILGAGGHGRVIADAAEATGRWGRIAFLDDRYPDLQSAGAWPVIGTLLDLAQVRPQFLDAAIGVGDNARRLSLADALLLDGFDLPVIAHPSAVLSKYADVAAATVVFAHATVNIGAVLGVACIVNTGATVEHDCILGRGVHISPGANLAGGTRVGERSWLGIGASVRQQIQIGENVVVGAGAVVVNDLASNITVAGVPAKELPRDSIEILK